MTDTEYADWVKVHTKLFWMTSKEDAFLFAEWKHLLNEYHFEELREASVWMACEPTKASAFRAQHLSLLRQRIQGRRYERDRREREAYENAAIRFRCKMCDNTGLVHVPHIALIGNGSWSYPHYTMVVACSCNIGSSVFNRTNDILANSDRRAFSTKRIIALENYEYLLSEQGLDWRELLQNRVFQRKREQEARYRAEAADRAAPLKSLITQTVKQIGEREPGSDDGDHDEKAKAGIGQEVGE